MHILLIVMLAAFIVIPATLGFRLAFKPVATFTDYMRNKHPKLVAKSVISIAVGILFSIWFDASLQGVLKLKGFGVLPGLIHQFRDVIANGLLAISTFFISVLVLIPKIGSNGEGTGILLMSLIAYFLLGLLIAVFRLIAISIHVIKDMGRTNPSFIGRAWISAFSLAALDLILLGRVTVMITIAGAFGFLIYVLYEIFAEPS